MQFCHISPTAYLEPLNIGRYKNHLILAHLLETDQQYADFYRDIRQFNTFNVKRTDITVIMDNSAYELYRRGLPMFDGDKLLDLADRVNADYIVMPDYPAEHSSKTIASAIEYGSKFHAAGYGTFFVPQSQIGDVEDYIAAFAWAASSPLVDYIGMSILGIPNAYGVDNNDIQRFLSRGAMFVELETRGLLQLAKSNGKKIHCLGMTDGPNEIQLLGRWIDDGTIDSWDSSAAIWAGIEGVRFDNSPTGLLHGKVKSHVDFDRPLDDGVLPDIVYNMKVIDNLVQG